MRDSADSTSIADKYLVAASMGRDLETFSRDAYGIDVRPAAESLGLDVDLFQNIDAAISQDRFCRLLQTLAGEADDPEFGLKYARAYRGGGTGAFGYGILNAPDVRSAMRFMFKYLSLTCDFGYLRYEVGGSTARLEWTFSPVIVQREQFVDFTTAVCIKLVATYFETDWLPSEVRLERQPPKAVASYRQTMARTVRFSSKYNAVFVSVADLTAPNPRADERLFDLMMRQCEARLQSTRRTLSLEERVITEIFEDLGRTDVAIEKIAKRLALSERSLQRHLKAKNLTFQALVDQARREQSTRLLKRTDLSLSEISDRLGFSATSAYTRSARRWYGMPPSEVRAQP